MTHARVQDAHYMARALELARRGRETTPPNPCVGCVLVRGDTVVGEGWHRRAGEPHAEVHALRAAGTGAAGATCYVTLEPCAHTGRTPPCADALIAAGVARVVVGMEDPNPLVQGAGMARLRAAGITVEQNVLQAEAEALNPGFLQRMRKRRPWVRVKLAATLDGRSATAQGESQWITSEPARVDVQQYRARASAILTGVATVLADNPRLNLRPPRERMPLRIVLDSSLRTPPGSALFGTPGAVLVVTTTMAPEGAERALVGAGAEILRLPAERGRVALGP
ncbi:MAG TPA: bifunctional diaminohydroxyphosphoribosylaminopyrimidine deaminase/5-amino-6-(5-phosphoribosylamino)uracil reductase RibD, partial [Acidiferrobacteraceae bacterium]|nr:bifunctional diaminohydroxyphosphoribosylaminopyrimidine deaminase/5-amino-6-(5-phosphoribosylamino)uracil reductase RibD [Acidiferrobacteraceae bacterium]